LQQYKQKQTGTEEISSLFQDSEGTNTSTAKTYTSYESPNTQLY